MWQRHRIAMSLTTTVHITVCGGSKNRCNSLVLLPATVQPPKSAFFSFEARPRTWCRETFPRLGAFCEIGKVCGRPFAYMYVCMREMGRMHTFLMRGTFSLSLACRSSRKSGPSDGLLRAWETPKMLLSTSSSHAHMCDDVLFFRVRRKKSNRHRHESKSFFAPLFSNQPTLFSNME